MVMVGRGAEGSLRVYVHDTTLRSQNAEQLRENGWLRCENVSLGYLVNVASFSTCVSNIEKTLKRIF